MAENVVGNLEGKIKGRTLHGVFRAVVSLFHKGLEHGFAMCEENMHIASKPKTPVSCGFGAHREAFF
ncbi:MAG: hypothetical protein ACR2O7_08800 [Parasphingorhabdus sp.]